jgi:predicted Zn finger-like uncharacterized protein
MKIVCDNCSTKYSIADEKVRGKVFKIKCKKCSHIIVVKGDVAPEGHAAGFDQKDTRVFDYSGFEGGQGGAAAAQDAIWHLVIDREQVGPLTIAELQAKFDLGEADPETYVWREGFADWQRLGSVDELAAVAKTRGAEKDRGLFGKTEGPADLFGTAKTQEAPADLFAAQRAPSPEAAVISSAGRRTGKSEDLFSDEAVAAASTAERLDSRPKMTAQRNENSVLFSLNNLASLATDSPKAAAPTASAASAQAGASGATPSGGGGIIGSASEGSGLIDIRAMAAMTLGSGGKKEDRALPSPSSDDDLPVFSATAFSAPASGVLLPTVATPSQSNRMIYILVGFVAILAIAAIGLVVFIMTGTKKDTVAVVPPPVTGTETPPPAPTPAPGVEPTRPAQPTAAPSQPKPGPAGPNAAPPAAPPPTATPTPPPAHPGQPAVAPPQKPPEKPPAKPPVAKPIKEAKNPDRPKEERPAEPPPPPPPSKQAKCDEVACMVTPDLPCCPKRAERPKETTPANSNLPEKLDQPDIIAAMRTVSGRVQSCNDTYRVAGAFKVRVTVAADGGVSAVAASPPMAGTPTGSCVEKAVKGAKFKKTKQSITFNYPYNFR